MFDFTVCDSAQDIKLFERESAFRICTVMQYMFRSGYNIGILLRAPGRQSKKQFLRLIGTFKNSQEILLWRINQKIL
jgi:hypothetical protein